MNVKSESSSESDSGCVCVCVCQGPALRYSAEVMFPRTQQHSGPVVQLHGEALQPINSTAEDHAFYQKYITPDSAVSAQHLPGVTNTNA